MLIATSILEAERSRELVPIFGECNVKISQSIFFIETAPCAPAGLGIEVVALFQGQPVGPRYAKPDHIHWILLPMSVGSPKIKKQVP